MDQMVFVEYQGQHGTWYPRGQCANNPVMIKHHLEQAAKASPTGRARVLDSNKRVVDML
jgi:hypothetical protein